MRPTQSPDLYLNKMLWFNLKPNSHAVKCKNLITRQGQGGLEDFSLINKHIIIHTFSAPVLCQTLSALEGPLQIWGSLVQFCLLPAKAFLICSCLMCDRLVLDTQRPLPDRRSYMLTVRHALTRKLTRSKTMQW